MIKCNHVYRNALALLFISAVAGCASVKNPDAPIAENYPHSMQKHLQASKHWQIVAEDTSNQIYQFIQAKKLANQTFYIQANSERTVFTKAFHDFIITSLVAKQVKVSREKANSTVVEYKVQPVKFNSYRSTLVPEKLKWTSLVAGVLVVRAVGDWIDQESFTTPLAIAGAADAVSANGAPSLELIITTSIAKNNIYLLRNSDIYYANATDIELYKKNTQMRRADVFNDPFYQY
jgi:hypothetical protein